MAIMWTRTETDMFNEILSGLTISGELPKITSDPTSWTSEQYTKWQVAIYNSTAKEAQDGYNCDACKNRGFFARINETGDFALRPCTCNNVRTQMRNAQNSGFGDMLNRYTFDGYDDKEDWQKRVKQGALLYTQQKELPWLYIGGMTGAGKSHICTATATRILEQGKVVKYVLWRDIFHKMESLRYDEAKYNEYLEELGTVEVLVIDDFLKILDKQKQGSALEIAFEIVNRRYNNRKATIFSSEIQLGELESYDKALHGRIKERCGKFSLNIKNEDSRNYRRKNEL